MSDTFSRGLIAFSFFVLISLSCFPVLFDWSNRIQPWVFNIPFSMFWQLMLISGMCLLLLIWCIADAWSGDLDVEIERMPKENNEER
ncbi:hypothetical protein [Paenibacillus naphthalenovorans]|uniref:DUF3311 domain-containing protein n=1 Tax=Paenibacillus naphthalenovorans TaxID=162209 RepID=A0A0U2IMF0_9BACL|nr:hypothetical protein [Paenibacillus naphthalenovorans]ALS22571.1 hypothetical protein IJ22_21970 [Paenibacillus naphthalenovorans]